MTTIANALSHYHEKIQQAGQPFVPDSGVDATFEPEFTLPPTSPLLREFFSPSAIKLHELGSYGGSTLRLLDLTCNPRTRTTKTFASYVMIARAVRHIHATGESILLITPSSGNKGGALRDAVLRATECGLVEPEQLRIAIVLPRAGLGKLWSSPLSTSPYLRRLNPVFVAQTGGGAEVKRLTRTFVQQHSARLWEEHGLRTWHTYQLDNYRMADSIRAFVEADLLGTLQPGITRVQAQAVSSAFGLLGYDHGREVLAGIPDAAALPASQWLLVQHLGTPDLVLGHLFGNDSRENLPPYRFDPTSGLYVQSQIPSFPSKTLALDEIIDSTFYSNHPITAQAVADALHRNGGTGIVVSLQECLERYGFIRSLLPPEGPSLPADPRDLREWALVMALTGVLGAIDRGIVPASSEIVVHASGCYSAADYVPVSAEEVVLAVDTKQILDRILEGCDPARNTRFPIHGN